MSPSARVQKIRTGLVDADPFLRYYSRRKQWAASWMMVKESSVTQDSPNYRPSGARKNSFRGIFNRVQWCDYIGATLTEYETIERKVRDHRNGGKPAMDLALVDRVLTALGRADLYQEWYGEIEVEKAA